MGKYIFKRVLIGIVTVFCLVTITFICIHIVPGGPFDIDTSQMTEASIANLKARYGVDKPLLYQYGKYLLGVLHGDLGESFQYTGTPVTEVIGRGVKATATLALYAFLLTIVVGMGLGIGAALKPGSRLDRICMAISTIGISLPNYVVAITVMYIFSLKLKLLPTMGLDSWKSYILPVVGLALNPIANVTKLMKTSMIEALNQDYTVMARSRGLKEKRVVLVHALKNALIPIITYTAPLVSSLLLGGFVVEDMFTIPGIGRIMATSITNRDYTTLTGIIIFYGTMVVLVSLLADIAYKIVDPRVKYE